MNRHRKRLVVTIPIAAILAWTTAASVAAADYGAWGAPSKIDTIGGNSEQLNTPDLDGCPIQSPDGLSLYLASNRGGGLGGIDIWIAHRASTSSPWGAPVNPGAPVNSSVDDFCPTPIRGGGLFFVSRRAVTGACGGSDIFYSRNHPVNGWTNPVHFACAADGGPNGPADEQGPSYIEAGDVGQLFYSSGADIFVSQKLAGWAFGPPVAVAGVNGPASDIQPNVRKDGLEIVFTSNDANRPGSHGANFDLYRATRASLADAWSSPVNLGNDINTAAQETRPSLSWNATQLLFGRNPGPEGNNDIFVSVRTR